MASTRQRHGCLTAWLIFLIVGNSLSILSNLAFSVSPQISSTLAAQGIDMPGWTWLLLAVLGIFNVVCAIGLLKWKKWGFYGFVASSVAAFIINLSVGVNIATSLFGFIGIAILYGVLNMGGENKAWPRLE
jgi:hypothetical protein